MHWDLSTVMLWLRVTARTSGVLFAVAFAASASRLLWFSPVTAWLAANRHRFTLAFVLSHTLHLAGVVSLASLNPERFFSRQALPGEIGGGLVYVLIYYLAYMAFLRQSNPELADSKMQTLTLYIVWIIFALAFTAGIWRNAWIYTPLASMMWLAWLVRIRARLAASNHAQSPAAA